MRFLIAAALAACLAPASAAQSYISLCPGQTGDALVECLQAAYTPTSTYSYDRARDTLFSFVDDGDRTRITDVYVGRVIVLRPGFDPTQEGCNGDKDNNTSTCSGSRTLNTEHAWPQSMGASRRPQQSDLHHLYPARGDVNSSRSNNPYAQFGYRSATSLYRDTLTFAPASVGADSLTFSATRSGSFMPRASVRGDLARSLFYFRAVYADTATARPERVAFFEGMKATLLRWHRADPPSAAEQARSQRVAQYQGRGNPFVLDTSLVARAFFAETLPVELLAFTGGAAGDGRVRLAWTTASETDNAAFTVDARHAGASTWQPRGALPGRGTTAERTDYRLDLDEPLPGRIAYRLTQRDLDGTARVVGTVEVEVTGLGLAVYPSPARTSVRVAGLAAPADVVDVLGRVVGRAVPGEALDVSAWAPGLYIVAGPAPVSFTVAR